MVAFFIQCTENEIITEKDFHKTENVNPLKNRAVTPDCFTPSELCQPYDITDTIEIPGYCGLHQVKFTAWHCPPTNAIYFSDFVANVIDGCDSLWNSWLYLNNNQLAVAFDRYDYAASLVAEKLYMQSILNPGIQCPTNLIEAHFYTNLCYRWCYIRNPRTNQIFKSKVTCGTKCCLRKQSYCYSNGVLQVSSPVFFDGGGNCGSYPVGQCNGFLVGNCERTCGIP